MATIFSLQKRNVVPNWRSFNSTVALGELNTLNKNNEIEIESTNIEDYIEDWRLNPTMNHAAELVSAAVVNNKDNDLNVHQAALFILENEKIASKSQLSLAEYYTKKEPYNSLDKIPMLVDLDDISASIEKEYIYSCIRKTKQSINKYPRNSILYVELARFYSILGAESKAVISMKIALSLAPQNRFVLRAATRLFAHFHTEQNNYLELIHNILRKNPITPKDPWLISAEISVASIRERSSNFIKKGLDLVNSDNLSPFNITELASSLGTVELMNGSHKKSRRLFNQSLINPNDNSLAQIEWASSKDKQLIINPNDYNVNRNYEALALDFYHGRQFDSALNYAARWFFDMPYSKRPLIFASNLASVVMKDMKKSISFLNAGLISHPYDPTILNNLAYAYALENNTEEAFNCLLKIRSSDMQVDKVTQICITATFGLIYFRKNIFDAGRKMYLSAIEETVKINDKELNWIAILNYAREEMLIKSDKMDAIMDSVNKIPDNCDNIEIETLKEDVIELYKKNKQE